MTEVSLKVERFGPPSIIDVSSVDHSKGNKARQTMVGIMLILWHLQFWVNLWIDGTEFCKFSNTHIERICPSHHIRKRSSPSSSRGVYLQSPVSKWNIVTQQNRFNVGRTWFSLVGETCRGASLWVQFPWENRAFRETIWGNLRKIQTYHMKEP